MKRYSLVLRLVACLCIAQVPAFFIAWLITIALGLMGWDTFATSFTELATVRAQRQVVESLAISDHGEIAIKPTAALREELKRAPGMKYAAFTSALKQPLPGSSPELISVLGVLVNISPNHTHFILPGDPEPVRMGLMEPKSTPFGKLHIAVYGQRFAWTDLADVAKTELSSMLSYLFMAVISCIIAAWLGVRWGLAPLRRVTEQARRIDMRSLHQRLDGTDIAREIGPMVDAFNEALARLDDGVARQRRFAANAAHELRTPVSILGARLDAPEEPTFRLDLKRDHRRIRNIVEQLLATARLGEQKAGLYEKLDLAALVRAMIGDAALLALRARRQLALDAPATPVFVNGNRSAIESVIANLVDNALRAEPEGGTVHLRVTEDASLHVIDHGRGVERGDREAVFEPFWRKDNSVPGTGLGLTIACEIIDAHRGRICVEDTPGGGATFRFRLPRLDQPGCE